MRKLMRAALLKPATTRPEHDNTPVTQNNANTITTTAGMVATAGGMDTEEPNKELLATMAARMTLPPFSF